MIEYRSEILSNGLTVVAHRDTATRMVAVNMLYKVGARDENPHRTGFAHLFEHLMFRGTRYIPDFDIPVQEACGENNAFTNNDYTDYYITLPKDNIETALWLEADRMTGLDITPEALATEKKVVIEEFNQRYLNQPYGDQWMLLRQMAYRVHPYQWATIGKTPQHIADATLGEVKEFYDRYYTPSNAILSIAGDIELEQVFALAEKWFARVTAPPTVKSPLPQEPPQTEPRREEVTSNVPADSITIALRMPGRLDRAFYVCDMISDLLAGGSSARLYQSLIKGSKQFSAINAYVTGDMDPGLFVVTGHLQPGTTVEEAESAIWKELDQISTTPVTAYELDKVKNKFEAGVIFGELNIMNKALNLAFYNMLGRMELINEEIPIFRSISASEIMSVASAIFRPQSSSTLIYRKENE